MSTSLLSDDNDCLIDLLNGLRKFNVDEGLIHAIKDTMNKRLDECQVELEEFQESSRELEQELEKQLCIQEKRNKELESINQRLTNENELIKTKLLQLSAESGKQINELQKKYNESHTSNEHLTRCIRELEQSNDDLERAKRALAASLDDFESRLNHQIERNVLLENELGEKEELEVIVQRLKDEARDLRCELMVQQQTTTTTTSTTITANVERRPMIAATLNHHNNNNNNTNTNNNNNINNNNLLNNNNINNNKMLNKTTIETGAELINSPISTPIKQQQQQQRLNYYQAYKNQTTTPTNTTTTTSLLHNHNQINSNNNNININNNHEKLPLLSPSTRISALNIVSDLLRKVGALESKLASCRNLVPPGTPKNKSTITSPLNSPNTYKDVNRECLGEK